MVKIIVMVLISLLLSGSFVLARPGPKVLNKQTEAVELEAGDKSDLETSASYGIGYYSGLGYPYSNYGYGYNSLGYGYPYGYSSYGYGYPSHYSPYYGGGGYYSGYHGYGGWH